MFGYIRIFKPQLRICEYEEYRAVYCTLCRELGKRYGPLSRMVLNYDYTFVTILYMALHKQSPHYEKGRCVFNPLKKCGFCTCDKEGFAITSAVTASTFYQKVNDNISDSRFFGKIGWWIVRLFAAPMRRKAKKNYPELDAAIADYIINQHAAETADEPSIDSVSEPTAQMISYLAGYLSDDEKDKRILADFGYYLGRWIYIIDALDDIEKDTKKRNFNPFVIKFGIEKSDIKENSQKLRDARDFANECLNMSISRAITAYNLLELGEYSPILDNVIFLGIGQSQKTALHEKELQHQ